MALLNITEDEWENAEKYFAQNFDQNPNLECIKMSKKIHGCNHSFIKVEDEIFALANRKCFEENKYGRLGEGTFGYVKVVQSKQGDNFAVKIESRGLRGENNAENKIMKLIEYSKGEAVREFVSLKKFRGDLISKKLYTVMQLREGQELRYYILNPTILGKKLTKDQRLLIALHSCLMVQGLHNKGIIHADIRPSNIMAKIEGNKIIIASIDFGLSMLLQPGELEIGGNGIGEDWYRAYEVSAAAGDRAVYSFASDIYALGIIFQKDLMLEPVIYEGMTKWNRDNRDTLNTVILNIISLLKQSTTLDEDLRQWINEIENGVRYSKFIEQQHVQLIYAAYSGNKKKCMSLIDKGAQVDARDQFGKTVLMRAAQNGQTDTCLALIEKGANINAIDYEGQTSLNRAAHNHHMDTCCALIKKGAKVDRISNYGEILFKWAAENKRIDICRLLIEQGVEFDAKSEYVEVLFRDVVTTGKTDLCSALINSGVNIDIEDRFNQTPLILAAEKGHSPTCQILIDHGAKVESKNLFGQTALIVAALNGHMETCMVLVKTGAKICTNTDYVEKLLKWAAQNGLADECQILINQGVNLDMEILMEAVKNGHKEVWLMFIEHGLRGDDGVFGKKALMMAAVNGQTDVCMALIERGVAVHTRALMCTAQKGHTKTCLALIEKGAMVDDRNEFQQTALMIAAQNGQTDTCLMLIDKGASIDAIDDEGKTALWYCTNNKYSKTCVELIRHGAQYDEHLLNRLNELNDPNINIELIASSYKKRIYTPKHINSERQRISKREEEMVVSESQEYYKKRGYPHAKRRRK